MNQEVQKENLFTFSYFCSCFANFLLFFCFYLLMPILALYLKEAFHSTETMVGAILSCYTVACLLIRPFSGFLVDTFARKPLYLLSLFFFVLIFAGYPLATSVLMFAVLRVLHGLSFGMVTIAGNTIVIDIMPSSRRGEGLGYYGLSNNFAMATGPMVGMYMLEHYGDYNVIFYMALAISALALFVGSRIKTKHRPKQAKEPVSLDRFILLKGIPAGVNTLMIAVPYGITTSYIALYALELYSDKNVGMFYTFMALGIALSRIFSGKQVDKGRTTQIITVGIFIATLAYVLLAFVKQVPLEYGSMSKSLFYAVALMVGLGYGSVFPALNSLFVGLSPNSKRGTANSTYLTSWDIGVGVGLMLGGAVGAWVSFSVVFAIGAFFDFVSLLIFVSYTSGHFHRNQIKS